MEYKVEKKARRYLRKSCYHREFRTFLEENGEDCNEIPYWCKIRWLSAGTTLKKSFQLKNSIATFFKEKGESIEELENNDWSSNLGILADFMTHMNLLNIILQGKNKLITEMAKHLRNFTGKLSLMKLHLANNKLDLF